jgi:subtilisin family serine protease
LFNVDCSTIGWAIVDTGIDADHPAFGEWWRGSDGDFVQGPSRVVRAFNFVNCRKTLAGKATKQGFIDWSKALSQVEMPHPASSTPPNSHGTHVAGIIGGHWPERDFRGLCTTIRLYDFRVLGKDGTGDEFSIVTALQAIRHINEQAGRMVIAGANLSLAVPHDVGAYSCGWTPICIECDRLTRSGVIVVTAAGNSGYAGMTTSIGHGYNTVSISDPGNTETVITVGSTHRSDPHRNGVSYFSSRGPTADGRAKPDILAPGEDIDGPVPDGGIAAMHGTSQAAAHVSGAAAMLVARYRELLGKPERVKSILCSTATDLGRTQDFQGSGLIDILRAMQSI